MKIFDSLCQLHLILWNKFIKSISRYSIAPTSLIPHSLISSPFNPFLPFLYLFSFVCSYYPFLKGIVSKKLENQIQSYFSYCGFVKDLFFSLVLKILLKTLFQAMVWPWKNSQRASYDPVNFSRKPPWTLNIQVQKAACDLFILVEKNDFWHKKTTKSIQGSTEISVKFHRSNKYGIRLKNLNNKKLKNFDTASSHTQEVLQYFIL